MALARKVATAVGVALIAATAFTSSATAQNTTVTSSTNSCPSQQTVMTSDWYGSSKGYLCAQEYHSGNRSIDNGASDIFTTNTDVDYFPQYYCWDSSDDKDFTYSHAEIFGSGTVTATNWGTGSHIWGAGYLYTLGSGSVTGWTNGCYDNANVWQDPPDLLAISSITGKNLPDNGQATAGKSYTINVTASPAPSANGNTVVIQDNGVSVAVGTFDSNGNAINSTGGMGLTWIPAEMGAHNIQVAWPGSSTALGNISDPYTINVSGGLAATVKAPTANNNGTATATVALDSTPDPFPTSGTVLLIDSNTQKGVGKATLAAPSSGTTTSIPVTFPVTPGQSYKLIAQVQDTTGAVLAQSYVMPYTAPVPTLTMGGGSWSSGYTSLTVTTTNIANGQSVAILKNGSVNTTVGVSNGVAKASVSQSGGTIVQYQATYTVSGKTYSSAVMSVQSPSQGGAHLDERHPARTGAIATERGSRASTARRRPPVSGTHGSRGPGSLTPAPIGVTVVNARTTRVTASRRSVSASCARGSYPLHAQASTSGPNPTFSVSFSGRRATFTSSSANVGSTMSGQVVCRPQGAYAQSLGAQSYGTRGRDTLSISRRNGTVLAGPGADRIRATGANSSVWGGLGRDRIAIAGRDSIAAGGPGRDRIIAVGPGRQLLWGGPGPDVLIGGPGNTLINARDGQGGDRIICRSASNRVMLDAGDVTTGACTVMAAD